MDSGDRASTPSPPALFGDSGDSTRHLLERFQRGDRAALSELFDRLLPSLRRWAHLKLPARLRGGNDTRDVVQDAVLKVLPHLDRFDYRQRRALRAYLRTVVQNKIRDELRRTDVRDAAAHRISDGPPDDSPFEAVAAQESLTRYRRGLEQLGAEDRELIVARIDLGYSYDQLALLSGKPSPDAARMAVKRALERLLKAMTETDER